MHVSKGVLKVEDNVRVSGDGVTDSCTAQDRCWEENSGAIQEQFFL